MAQLNFDATTVAPDAGFDTIPAGWYIAKIDQSEMKPTKDGAGSYLELRFEVLDGQYRGRKIFSRLNLVNANQQAKEIAFGQLSAIAHAVGVLHVQDSSQLHGIPLKVKVKIRKDTTGQYEDQNEINSFKNINEQVDMAGGAVPGVQGGMAGGAPAGFGQPQQPPQTQQPPQQQPWAGQPQQPPAQQSWQAPPQQQVNPNQQTWQQPQGQQTWQQPQGQQPWAGQPQQPPAGQPQQMQQPPQGQHPAQGAMPPWGGPPQQ